MYTLTDQQMAIVYDALAYTLICSHYKEAGGCRLTPSHGVKDDLNANCLKCDVEALLKKLPIN